MGDRVALVCAGPASEGRQRTSAAVAVDDCASRRAALGASEQEQTPATRSARGRSAEGRRAWRAGLGRCVEPMGDWRWCRGKRVR